MNILVLLHPGTNSRSILRDAARGIERAGHRLFLWDTEPMSLAYQRDEALKPRLMSEYTSLLAAFIRANRIDASIGMWANGLLSFMNSAAPAAAGQAPRPISFFDQIGCPHILFWLDAPHWAHEGTFVRYCRTPIVQGPRLVHLINNPHTAREMTDILGFSNVLPRSYGVCEETFAPCPDVQEEFDLVFASGPGDPPPTPSALEELASDEPDMLRIRRDAATSALKGVRDLASRAGSDSPAVEELLRELIQSQLANRDEPMLDRLARFRASGLSRAVDLLCASPQLFVDATARTRSVERFERAFTLAYLARRFSVGLMGNGDYSAWGCRATPLGYVPHEAQSRAYARARLGLNVMRWQDDAGLNLKCFEITASGVACLTTRRAGLADLFGDGREVASFATPGQAARAVRELLESPDRRKALARAGRARTLRDHTWTAWAREAFSRISSAPA